MRLRILLIVLVVYLLLVSTIDSSTWQYSDCGGFRSYAERLSYMKLMKKHGLLNGHVQVVYYDEQKHVWFYRNKQGQRCTLH